VAIIGRSFKGRPRKSLRHVSVELNISQRTVHRILKMNLHDHAYKIWVIQMLQKKDDYPRFYFATSSNKSLIIALDFLSKWHFLRHFTLIAKYTATISAFGEERNIIKSGNSKEIPQSYILWKLRKLSIIGSFISEEPTVNGKPFYDVTDIFVPELWRLQLLPSEWRSLLLRYKCATALERRLPTQVDRERYLTSSFAWPIPLALPFICPS
jgi:hypothetical protein